MQEVKRTGSGAMEEIGEITTGDLRTGALRKKSRTEEQHK